MPFVPGLRSAYATVRGLVYFGRMLDKIRLLAAGRLPSDYLGNLGIGFDGRACQFLGIEYAALRARTLAGGNDEELLDWAHAHGGPRTREQFHTWNGFMMKLGWRDARSAVLRERIATYDLGAHPIETFFDLNDYDEGRDPVGERSWELHAPRIVLLMGVMGSGKTTVGQALAAALGWPWLDADDLHPAANRARLAAGQPLNDADRAPWLAEVAARLEHFRHTRQSAVVACSALTAAYRAQLVTDPGVIKLVHLHGDPALIVQRLAARTGHFAAPSLLASQLATLETPAEALQLDCALPPAALVERIRAHYPLTADQ